MNLCNRTFNCLMDDKDRVRACVCVCVNISVLIYVTE